MQVSHLIAQLRLLPQDAHVVVGHDVIHGADVRCGSLQVGHYNPQFSFHANGKDRAVVFLANEELSSGEVVSSRR